MVFKSLVVHDESGGFIGDSLFMFTLSGLVSEHRGDLARGFIWWVGNNFWGKRMERIL